MDGKKDKVHPFFHYLEKINNLDSYKSKAKSVEDFLDVDQLEEAIQVQICYRIKRLIDQRAANEDVSTKDFTNSLYALDIVNVALEHIKMVCLLLLKSSFRPNPLIPRRTYFKCPENKKNVANGYCIYALNMLYKDS